VRIISFSTLWPKLLKPDFTTFRYRRKDTDWYQGERVQVFLKNRSPKRKRLGEAVIVFKEPVKFGGNRHITPKCRPICEEEAIEDGFQGIEDMMKYMMKQYGRRFYPAMNKLTLKWVAP
jgi:hypothetical protein